MRLGKHIANKKCNSRLIYDQCKLRVIETFALRPCEIESQLVFEFRLHEEYYLIF